MSRHRLGQLLVALGALLVVVGALGTVIGGTEPAPTAAPTTAPTAEATTPGGTEDEASEAVTTEPTTAPATTASPAATATAPPGASFAEGAVADPEDDVYVCADGSTADAEPRVDITDVTYRPSTTNPATGGDASSLLVTVRAPFRADTPGAEAIVLLGSAAIDGQPSADRLEVGDGSVQVRMTYQGPDADPAFAKSLRRWDGGAWSDADASAHNVRFQGVEDHVEFEFFGPPGTTFAAVLVTDTTTCDLATPAG